MEIPPQDVTRLLIAWSHGDETARDQLFSAVYGELRKIAHNRLRGERQGRSLLTSDLVHEAFLRLVKPEQVNWHNRAHFFAFSAKIMRRILINHARDQKALKRGGGMITLTLDEAVDVAKQEDVDLVALDEALKLLETLDPRQLQIVELRYFAGLTIDETAAVMGISKATVSREWDHAKLWLHNEISRVGEKP